MKVKDIVESYYTLQGIADKKLPSKLAFVICRNLRKMKDITDDVEQTRNSIVDRYAKRDADGNVMQTDNNIQIADADGFTREIDELLMTETELQLDKISEEDVEKCDDDKYDALTVAEINALEIMMY